MTPLIRLFIEAKHYRGRIMLAAFCSMFNTLCDILPEILIGIAVNVLVQGQHSVMASMGITNVRSQILVLGIVTFFIWCFESFFQYSYALLWRGIAQLVQHDLRLKAYRHMQKLPMSYYENKPIGSLLSLLNDDINQLERFMDNGINQFIYFIVSTVVASSLFIYLSPTLAAFMLLPLPIIFVMTFAFQKKLSQRYAAVREQAGALAERLVTNIAGITIIKSYTTQDYEQAAIAQASKGYKQASRSAIKLGAAFIPIVRLVVVIGFVFTIVLGGWQVLDGVLDVGAYSILVFQTQRLLWPFAELAQMTDLYGRASASAQRVLDVLKEPVETVKGTLHLVMKNVKGGIEFNDVSFTYPHGGGPIFNHLSFTIKPGTTAAFVGTTGSGKSTIIKLLLRFYDPTDGVIALDGTDITTINPHDVRRAIALVSQDVFLVQGTIYDNIVYGTFDATIEQVIEAAKVADAHTFIESFPQGYHTVIGERGQKLSGGQKQRLSIARAVLKNSPILIFDEATSSVDNETEIAIARSLEQITKKHTVIMVAHRLSMVRHADTIFVMSDGAVVESGTHDELVARGGVYTGLWNVQTGVV